MRSDVPATESPAGLIPTQWKAVRLGEQAEIKARIGWRGLSASEYTTNGPYLIAGKHLSGGSILWDECDHLSQERYEESHEIALREGDVVLSKDGTIGRVGFIDSLPGQATINGTMMLVRPIAHLGKFLFYFLQGESFQRLIKEKVSGSSVPHIFQRDMVQLWAPLPPLAEQRKIAAILTSVDEAIQATEAVIAQTRRVKEGLLQELLTKGIGHTRFKQTLDWAHGKPPEITQVPEDWEIVSICKVAKLESGHTPSRRVPEYWGGEFRWLSLHDTKRMDAHVVSETTLTITNEGLANSSARLLPEGTVALSRTATIGKCVILGRRMATSQDFACYICGDKLYNKFLLHVFRYMQHVWAALSGGSTHKTVYMPIFEKLQIALPPWKEQAAIVSILDSFDEEVIRLRASSNQMQQLKSGLLQDLLTGRVRVTP